MDDRNLLPPKPIHRLFTHRTDTIVLMLQCCLLLASSGCGARNPLLSSGPVPRVEDCMIVQQATPARFVCGDGKTYTSLQLSEIRTGKGSPSK
jgi:hypothetical protein